MHGIDVGMILMIVGGGVLAIAGAVVLVGWIAYRMWKNRKH